MRKIDCYRGGWPEDPRLDRYFLPEEKSKSNKYFNFYHRLIQPKKRSSLQPDNLYCSMIHMNKSQLRRCFSLPNGMARRLK